MAGHIRGLQSINVKHRTIRFAVVAALLVQSFGVMMPQDVALAADAGRVVINEISPDPDSGSEWVELYNPTDKTQYLSGWTLKDAAKNTTNTEELPESVNANTFVIVEANDLNNGNDTLILSDGTHDYEVTYSGVGGNQTYARVTDGDGDFEVRTEADATKGFSNSEAIPTVPTGLHRIAKDDGERLECSPIRVVTRQTVWPTWVENEETDFSHYEYRSINSDGEIGIENKRFEKGETQYRHGWVPPHDGKSGFMVRAVDAAGNKSDWSATCYIVYDNEKPEVALMLPSADPTVGGEKLVITGTISDKNAVTYYYQVLDSDKKTVADYGKQSGGGSVSDGELGELNIGGLKSGDYYVMLWAVDAAGNESLRAYAAFTVDHTAPIATMNVNSSASPSANTPIELSGRVSEVNSGTTLLLKVDGNEVADITDTLEADGSWSYTLENGLVQGKHSLMVVVTDRYGNSSTPALSPASMTKLTVGAYIPPQGSMIPTELTSGLDDQFATIDAPTDIVATTTPNIVDKQPTPDTEVLGLETTEEKSIDLGEIAKTPAVAPSESGWKFFGVAWYWWLFAGAALGSAMWWVAAARRQRQQVL